MSNEQHPIHDEAGAEPDVYEHVREKIRELRTNQPRPISQTGLAKSLGVPSNTVSRWETGKYRPDLDDVHRMARFFNVPVSDFFPGESQERDQQQLERLLGAARQLPERDLEELRRFAEFRRAQAGQQGETGQ